MADQYAGVDAWGMPFNQQPYDNEEYFNEDVPSTMNPIHGYSQTVQELDGFDDNEHNQRRYSAIDFDTTQYMSGYDLYGDPLDPIDRPDAQYTEHAARQKIAQLATIARRHETLLQQQRQAIEDKNTRNQDQIYQKVQRPQNRAQWVNGTHVLVQRDKSSQWFHGTIVNVYLNAMNEEVLTVLYYEFRGNVKYKTVRRYDKNVKAPNEDAWELFKAEEEKNMTLYQKLFTGIKGPDLYEGMDMNGNDGMEMGNGLVDMNGDGFGELKEEDMGMAEEEKKDGSGGEEGDEESEDKKGKKKKKKKKKGKSDKKDKKKKGKKDKKKKDKKGSKKKDKKKKDKKRKKDRKK